MIWSGYVYRHPIDDSMAPLLVPWVFDVFRLGKGLASDPTLYLNEAGHDHKPRLVQAICNIVYKGSTFNLMIVKN